MRTKLILWLMTKAIVRCQNAWMRWQFEPNEKKAMREKARATFWKRVVWWLAKLVPTPKATLPKPAPYQFQSN